MVVFFKLGVDFGIFRTNMSLLNVDVFERRGLMAKNNSKKDNWTNVLEELIILLFLLIIFAIVT